MPPKAKLKVVSSLYNKTTPTLTFTSKNRHTPNPPSDVRHNVAPRDCHENREKDFFIKFDGQRIHVEERRPTSLSGQRNVQINSSHMAQHNKSIHDNILAGFPDVQSNSSHMAQHNRSIHDNTLTGLPDVQSNSFHMAQHNRSIHDNTLTGLPGWRLQAVGWNITLSSLS